MSLARFQGQTRVVLPIRGTANNVLLTFGVKFGDSKQIRAECSHPVEGRNKGDACGLSVVSPYESRLVLALT